MQDLFFGGDVVSLHCGIDKGYEHFLTFTSYSSSLLCFLSRFSL